MITVDSRFKIWISDDERLAMIPLSSRAIRFNFSLDNLRGRNTEYKLPRGSCCTCTQYPHMLCNVGSLYLPGQSLTSRGPLLTVNPKHHRLSSYLIA
jgi:hypothetical protein